MGGGTKPSHLQTGGCSPEPAQAQSDSAGEVGPPGPCVPGAHLRPSLGTACCSLSDRQVLHAPESLLGCHAFSFSLHCQLPRFRGSRRICGRRASFLLLSLLQKVWTTPACQSTLCWLPSRGSCPCPPEELGFSLDTPLQEMEMGYFGGVSGPVHGPTG